MDATEVTNAEFAAFVKATGYVTVAERTPRAEDLPGVPPENLVAGSVVFSAPRNRCRSTTRCVVGYVPGASWRHPLGPKQRSAEPGRRIRSCTSPTKMPRPTRNGPASGCRPKPNGSSPRAAGSPASSIPGATTSWQDGHSWPTSIRAIFPITTPRRRVQGHRAGRAFRAERLRPLRRRRQRLGVVERLVSARLLRRARRGWRRRPQSPGPSHRSTPTEPGSRSVSTAAARSSAPTSTARATWSARAAKATSDRTNHLGFRLVKPLN